MSLVFGRLVVVTELTGTLIRPGDTDYDAASTTYAATGAPAVIVRPSSAADVAAAVLHARDNGLVLSVRSGGHGGHGLSTNTGGLVIDLSSLASIAVDGDTVTIGGGAVWGDIAAALRPHELALTSGDTVSVGVGGLTLGGGIGWMVRQYGLALDSLVDAEIVTASGAIVRASDEPDLYWAIRGGGGNFGVVTSFVFRAHPLRQVVAGSISFGADNLAGLLRGWRDVMRAAPEQLNATFLAMPGFGPEMPAGIQVLVCYAGDDRAAADAAIAPLLALPGVLASDITVKDYADVLEEAHPPEGITSVVNNGFAPTLSDELVDELASVYSQLGASVLMIRSLRGALNRIEADATAFAWRDSEVLLISAAFLPPDADGAAIARVRDVWHTLQPRLSGSYGNFLTTADENTVESMYPPATLARLREIKRTWDPANLFNQNQNIRPA